jgi:hypothetical protein
MRWGLAACDVCRDAVGGKGVGDCDAKILCYISRTRHDRQAAMTTAQAELPAAIAGFGFFVGRRPGY